MDLNGALREALAREAEPAYLLDRQGTLLFVNDAWDRAARACDAPPTVHAEARLGKRWLDGVHGRVRRYYAALLARAFSLPQGDEPRALVHLSECNDDEWTRVVAHRFIPLYSQLEVFPPWLLVVHAPVSQAALCTRHPLVDGALHRYRDATGRVVQCSACRRTRVGDGDGQAGGGVWEMCPALIACVPAGCHFGLCRDCRQSYYVRPSEQPLRGARAAKLPRSAGLWLSARMLPVGLAEPGL